MVEPRRGEVWLAELEPVRGHEQGGTRPVLVVSRDSFNRGPVKLAVVLPLTSTLYPNALHVLVDPPEGGLERPSMVLCEAVRSITHLRLVEQWGTVSEATMASVEYRLRGLLEL